MKVLKASIILIAASFVLSSCSNSDESAANTYKIDASSSHVEISEETSGLKFKSEIMLDNNKIDLKNDVYLDKESGTVIAELKDVCDTFDIKLNYDSELEHQIVLEKYEYSYEIAIADTDSYYPSNIKRFPGGVAESYENIAYVKDNMIYVILNDILKFFHYDFNYDKLDDKIVIKNNDDRKKESYNDIYLNVIKSYFDLSDKHIDYYFDYTEHLVNYLKLSSNPDYRFVLHDFTNDGVPELLLHYQNQDGNDGRGVSGWLMYKYNDNTKSLEKVDVKSDYVFSYIFGYDMQNRLYTIRYNDANPMTSCYVWDNLKGFKLLDRKEGVIDDKIIRFDGIDENYIQQKNTLLETPRILMTLVMR